MPKLLIYECMSNQPPLYLRSANSMKMEITRCLLGYLRRQSTCVFTFSYQLTKDKVDAGIKQAQIQAESEAWLVHWLQSRYLLLSYQFLHREKMVNQGCYFQPYKPPKANLIHPSEWMIDEEQMILKRYWKRKNWREGVQESCMQTRIKQLRCLVFPSFYQQKSRRKTAMNYFKKLSREYPVHELERFWYF